MPKIPKNWFNIIPTFSDKFPKPLNPTTNKEMKIKDYREIIPKELAKQELLIGKYGKKTKIKIPREVLDLYKLYRPTPLARAERLEKYLNTPAKIYYKREDASPVGSHKLNTSIPQVFYSKKEDAECIVTDTGAGQWGSAIAISSNFFGLKSIVFMLRKSYEEKPYRVMMMKMFGSEVIPSPSDKTKTGKIALEISELSKTGSLGIGMSEAIETVMQTKGARLALGCMSNYAVLHQTVIGNECMTQLKKEGLNPDIMIGCVGGGSNLGGFCYPFIPKFTETKFIAAESDAVPVLTKGEYRYDFQDYLAFLPMIKMYTLGHKFLPPPIHSGGLRYHGKNSTLSYLVNKKIIEPRSYSQDRVFEAGKLFAKLEGIVPAPETSHAIAAVIEEAERCKRENKEKTIVFNFSGHGLLDLENYKQVLF
ncbi:MAG: TrpB-like pyridoxal phosphate-dependent enzyme [Candidatus Aenigmarchaeota archaeon]|nr:TrpB-like pyridoxal phosphate-dependent enzyme [Candidatus Aenigmarchaeota archaeon]